MISPSLSSDAPLDEPRARPKPPMPPASFEFALSRYKKERSVSWAISNISGYALSAQQGSLLLAEAAQLLAYGGGGKTHQLIHALIEDGFYKGLRPNQISPCPLATLCFVKRHSGSRPLPCQELWHDWSLAIASQMTRSPEDQLAIFSLMFHAPHPKTLSVALKTGLAALPERPALQELARSVWGALRAVRAQRLEIESRPSSVERWDPAPPLLVTLLCDQLAALPAFAPPALAQEDALATAEAACAFNAGRQAVSLILSALPLAPDQGTLAHWAGLSARSYPGLQAARALGALYASPFWEPEARERSARSLAEAALARKDQPLFVSLAPHCDWSDLAPAIQAAFSAPVLARLEREALQSKRVSGLSPASQQERPAARKARL